jgi:hypothetical protein
MKKIFNSICNMFTSLGEAAYAAHLARNHQWQRARSLYEK